MKRDTGRYRVLDTSNKTTLGEYYSLGAAVAAEYAVHRAVWNDRGLDPSLSTKVQRYATYLRIWVNVPSDECVVALHKSVRLARAKTTPTPKP